MIQLLIEIDDKTYRTIKDGLFLIKGGRGSGRIMEYNALKSIYDGKPLPKGHGRLIDGDSLKKCFHYGEANTNNENDMIMAVRRIIESVPTVIEADKN